MARLSQVEQPYLVCMGSRLAPSARMGAVEEGGVDVLGRASEVGWVRPNAQGSMRRGSREDWAYVTAAESTHGGRSGKEVARIIRCHVLISSPHSEWSAQPRERTHPICPVAAQRWCSVTLLSAAARSSDAPGTPPVEGPVTLARVRSPLVRLDRDRRDPRVGVPNHSPPVSRQRERRRRRSSSRIASAVWPCSTAVHAPLKRDFATCDSVPQMWATRLSRSISTCPP